MRPRLDKDATKFVSASRQTVADRVVECHINELVDVDDWAYLGPKDAFDKAFFRVSNTKNEASLKTANPEVEEIEDLDTDEKKIIFEHVQQFIFEGAPFQNFVSNLKLYYGQDHYKDETVFQPYCYEVLEKPQAGPPYPYILVMCKYHRPEPC
ncbi:hypothetical protein NW752_010889 [Fusarium irregulare]|nr:hypothetical protein NW752_010889 [Fusarium irregulare]